MVDSVCAIIPCYNYAKYVGRALDSVKGQLGPPLSIEVVDDCSTDDPACVVLRHAPLARVTRHERNRGISASRNTAIGRSEAEFLALLDADDWWEPQKTARQLELFALDPMIDVAFCDFDHVLPDGSFGAWRGGLVSLLQRHGVRMTQLSGRAHRIETRLTPFLVRHLSFLHPSTVVLRRSAIRKAGLFDESYRSAEDLEMWLRCAETCRFGVVDELLVHTEQRPGSLGRNLSAAARAMLRLLEALPRLAPDVARSERRAVRFHKAAAHLTLAWEALVAGRAGEAREHALISIANRFRLEAAKIMLAASLPPPIRRVIRKLARRE